MLRANPAAVGGTISPPPPPHTHTCQSPTRMALCNPPRVSLARGLPVPCTLPPRPHPPPPTHFPPRPACSLPTRCPPPPPLHTHTHTPRPLVPLAGLHRPERVGHHDGLHRQLRLHLLRTRGRRRQVRRRRRRPARCFALLPPAILRLAATAALRRGQQRRALARALARRGIIASSSPAKACCSPRTAPDPPTVPPGTPPSSRCWGMCSPRSCSTWEVRRLRGSFRTATQQPLQQAHRTLLNCSGRGQRAAHQRGAAATCTHSAHLLGLLAQALTPPCPAASPSPDP
jgi:hypothetical protein